MSWFNASQLSSFAKQALSTAQKSIDRVLDIKEEEQWGDTPLPTYHGRSPARRPGTGSSPEAESPEDPEPGETIRAASRTPKDGVAESKDSKPEDRQSDTPSPPGQRFSSGTSTTSDIEVLDHEERPDERARPAHGQETDEARTASTCCRAPSSCISASACAELPAPGGLPQADGERGLSSDAFERIDSFSVQSLDSRSTPVKDQSLDENDMEESGRSSTPVNCRSSRKRRKLISGEAGSLTSSHGGWRTREGQLLSVSKDKAGLDELCDNLKDEIISLKDEASSVQSLKEEFTQRIAEAERKAQLACKERDIAKKEIKGLRDELSTRFNSNETLELIREKEEQIRELLDEGEKLSKQQLQHSNIIKKTAYGKKVKDQEDELRHLQQVADLRVALQRAEQQQAKKEDYLREEISELQQRLQAAETRNQELSQSVTTATRPLLRQIENLQATLGSQTASWEKLEKSISDRLGEERSDAQAQLAVAVEKERAATEDLQAMKTQVVSLESQNSLLRQDKGRLQGELDGEKSKREDLEDCNSRLGGMRGGRSVEKRHVRGRNSNDLSHPHVEQPVLTVNVENKETPGLSRDSSGDNSPSWTSHTHTHTET
uniref:Uncharacterized protein n=1 Tax=Denticeps clupeoides TaxID=299321 RepID=A0AAY4CXZ5_9TELE